MSLFDVIKYPISDPPRIQELKALPDHIIAKWMYKIRWESSVHALFNSVTNRYDYDIDHPRIIILRKIIKDLL